jgi:gamma-glutamylaminecyclotransferase
VNAQPFIGCLAEAFNARSGMVRVFAFGTLKRGFPLHHGLAGAAFLGAHRTVQRFPMFVAGPWFAPMMMNEPGAGQRVLGELYEIDAAGLARIDMMESIGKPGNFRISIEIEPMGAGALCMAFAYMKSRALADPIHTDYLECHQDPRFIPPARRPSP